MDKKHIYMIAGEASGDLHASNLVRELKKLIDVEIEGMGGEAMEKAGVKILHDYRKVNFMGFVDVFMHLRTILKKIKEVKKEIENKKPDAVILVDYPGFNMRIAKHCRSIGIKVIYYISPQIWAWKQSRVHQIKATVDTMITILPFEKAFYEKFGMEVEFAGHPLLDAIHQFPYNQDFIQALTKKAGGKKIIALLPGSRKQEIQSKLPVMIKLAHKYKDQYYFVVAGAPGANPELYANTPFDVYYGETYNILKVAYAALVTSGTATLETALHNVPQVVCYKANEFNYQIGKRLVKVNYISLVNLILDKPAVVELIQRDLNDEQLEKEFLNITGAGREPILKHYHELQMKLGDSGTSAKVANIIKSVL